MDEIKNFVDALMNDLRENFSRDMPLSLRRCARQLDHFVGIDHRLVRTTVPLLQALCVRLRESDPLHDVVSDTASTKVDRREMTDLSFVKNCNVGGAGSHLDECDAKLLLFFSQNS